MSAQYEILPPGGHETYAEKIFTKIKGLFDTKVKTDVPANAVFTDYKSKIEGSYQGIDHTVHVDTVVFDNSNFEVSPGITDPFGNSSASVTLLHSVDTDVPSNAIFTDTKNTAGSTDTSSKIFLIGATSQAANSQTYSQDTAYVGTDGCLYSGGTKVLTAHQDISEKVSIWGDTVAGEYNNRLTDQETPYKQTIYNTKYSYTGLNILKETREEGGDTVDVTMDITADDITLSTGWDGTNTSLKDAITYLGSQSAANKVDKAGDTMTGDISWNGRTGYTSGLYWKEYGYGDKFKIAPYFSGANDDNFLGFQAAVGGAGTDPNLAVILKIHPSGKITTTNQVIGKNPASSWIGARDAACFKNPNFANNGSYYPVISTKTKSGTWSIGVLSNEEQLRFCWESDSNYNSNTNASTSVILRATAGTIALTSEILPKAGGTMTGNFKCGNTTIYSGGSNGGLNSVIFGDDVYLGDCNVGGMLGMKSTGANCGIRCYNSSGTLIGGFQMTGNTPQCLSGGTAYNIIHSGGGSISGQLTMTSGRLQLGSAGGAIICSTALISRHDTGDSGYVNIVTYKNSAYAPIRSSGFTTMSCKHTKTNVVDISEEDALKLLDIRPVNFDYIEEVGGLKDQIGVLAEDTYDILPKVVSVPDDYVEEDFDISKGIHQPLPSVDYAKFVPYLIKLVQIQQKEINELRALV